jgi:hypothetical protein
MRRNFKQRAFRVFFVIAAKNKLLAVGQEG